MRQEEIQDILKNKLGEGGEERWRKLKDRNLILPSKKVKEERGKLGKKIRQEQKNEDAEKAVNKRKILCVMQKVNHEKITAPGIQNHIQEVDRWTLKREHKSKENPRKSSAD